MNAMGDEDKKDDLKKEYESDKDAFKEKYDIPNDPKEPLPPSGDPRGPDKRN